MKLEAIEFKMQSQSLFFIRPAGEGCKMKTSVFLDNFRRYNNIGKVASVPYRQNRARI